MTLHHEFLRRLPLFADLSDNDIGRFLERVTEMTIDSGTTLMREGEMGDAVYIVLDGELDVLLERTKPATWIDKRVPGDVIGEMAPLINEPRKATVRARTQARLLKIDSEDFVAVFRHSSTAAMTLLRTVAMRLRSMESELGLQNKMAALGTLAAGLAHELNNPAAAMQRSTDHLRTLFDRFQTLAAELGVLSMGVEERDALTRLLDITSSRADAPRQHDPLAFADREERLEEWLSDHAVDRPWDLASALADTGLDDDDLHSLAQQIAPEHLATALWWVATGAGIARLLAELMASASSISDIVAAVKSYTQLDRAPIQEVDVRDGIEQTLMILHHTLRNVAVHRDYAPDLPRITAWASELNQVWANIISNAIDAMGGSGDLTIHTACEGDWVVVGIEDTGPGIPPEIQPRVFDPFFTTKDQGQGTGLGLHISYNIITQKHHGNISVTSRPGSTRFDVALPIALPTRPA